MEAIATWAPEREGQAGEQHPEGVSMPGQTGTV
jgi:hypothetical protein